MTHQLHRLSLVFAAGFFLVALASGYWGFLRRDDLVSRADNPRRALNERRVPRGAIYDRHGAALAESVGTPGHYERRYPYPALAPVIGYVSPFYGAAGIEAAADPVLHGDAGQDAATLWLNNLMGTQPPGRDVRLSIDLRLQAAADSALGERAGAAVLLDAATGEILALASHPTYAPNRLDADWQTLVDDPRAPLLNRATFALYQPGGALQPIILAAALRAGLAELDAPFPSAAAPVGVGHLILGCRTQPSAEAVTLTEAFQLGCPWPFAELGGQLGAHALDQLFSDFRLYEAPPIAIPAVASARSNLSAEGPIAALGQGSLNLTPLHLALVAAAIARDGEMPAPHLLIAEESADGEWQTIASPSHPIAAIPPEVAQRVKALMADGHTAVALTGAEGKRLAWFSGFAPFDDSRYAVAVLLEDGEAERAAQIGRELLATAVNQGSSPASQTSAFPPAPRPRPQNPIARSRPPPSDPILSPRSARSTAALRSWI
jgi:peptidoglycan glycosyltransferase